MDRGTSRHGGLRIMLVDICRRPFYRLASWNFKFPARKNTVYKLSHLGALLGNAVHADELARERGMLGAQHGRALRALCQLQRAAVPLLAQRLHLRRQHVLARLRMQGM